MDASAVPHFRNGGTPAAAQTFGARRHTRGEAATMVDVTAGQGGVKPGGGFPSLSEIGDILKRGDLALALGVLAILVLHVSARRFVLRLEASRDRRAALRLHRARWPRPSTPMPARYTLMCPPYFRQTHVWCHERVRSAASLSKR